MLQHALTLYENGLSIIPVNADKKPLLSGWQTERLKPGNLFNTTHGIGLVCGANSGNVEAIDIDCKYDLTTTLYTDYAAVIDKAMPGLLSRLVIEKTVNHGYHIIYRCSSVQGNLKLAQRPASATELLAGDKMKVLIETRGQGGYLVVAPTPGYTLLQGSLSAIPEITPAERNILLQAARSFNQVFKEAPDHRQHFLVAEQASPFQLYNEKANLTALLEKHGWKVIRQSGKFLHMLRPGSTNSLWSASINLDTKQFHVFSQSTQFEEGKNYTAAAVFCLLETGNDWKKCHRLLLEQGYGTPPPAKLSTPATKVNGQTAYAAGDDKKLDEIPLSPAEMYKKHEHLRMSTNRPIEKPEPIIKIQGISICTPGNLTVITGPEKSAKTSFLSLLLSGCVATTNGFEGSHLVSVKPNPEGKAIIAIDTEQSMYDSYNNFSKRILKRAMLEHEPAHFYYFNFRGLHIKHYQAMLDAVFEIATKKHGGIFLCAIDGGADFIVDTNDMKESLNKVTVFSLAAMKHNTSIIQIVHLNPGSDKERGHYGSELRRKCESALSVKREGDMSIIEARLLRSGGASDFAPMLFKFDKEKGYHCFVEGEIPDRKEEKLKELAELVFEKKVNASEAAELIMAADGCGERKAKAILMQIYNRGFIDRFVEGKFVFYQLKDSHATPGAETDSITNPDDEEAPF